MSAQTDLHADHSHETDHGSVKSYLVGFALSVILTAIPFWAVMTAQFDKATNIWLMVTMAIVQVVVHLKYFLHLNFSEQGRANTFAFLFTALIIVMVVGLSIWIIYASNAMMMH
ncbi:cytochrome o ubiquinol oxidase subunit IV [Microbulbifer harenosus]|uniref:Cytochrome bo(3) ubiquinol oxidase subunit 4 n=1 Tax=Microbulbifer harenosus TaxID=2576840 RepID=A0ABY2UM87_9GAMM|nr:MULTISPECIES: cytochrome o ubiquinol oxidase subunit IV [Microbulbifer]QIL91088.1 cytochrome o ubiquinol oxidase subunit IV [Microbulbifer sp. SH-1]TLM79307.1 cytochrome o ubiquinol oxidase subunit IV [Microbulbifer harenosus]